MLSIAMPFACTVRSTKGRKSSRLFVGRSVDYTVPLPCSSPNTPAVEQ
jgi:hypothetical protein